MNTKKKRVGVIGVGSAGLLNAMHLCVWLDKSWEVHSIYDPNKKILGIGESTNGGFVNLLEQATNFTLASDRDLEELGATLKFGSRFADWRPHEWINPLLNGNVAVHFDNQKLRTFAFERLKRRWPDQFRTLTGEVQELVEEADRVVVRMSGGQHEFDYVVDCRGVPETYDGYQMSDCTLLDRCLVHRVEAYEFRPFTDHVATEHGWMFGVPLRDWKTYGYLYSSAVSSRQRAEEDMCRRLGVTTLHSDAYRAEYSFESYYAKELVSGRICKNGNRALFFEPLIANSIFLYLYSNRLIFDYITDAVPSETVNGAFVSAVREMEDLISYYYQGGSMHASEFWKAATAAAQQRLRERTELLDYLGQLRAARERGVLHTMRGYGWAPQTWQIVDEQLGYGYVDPDA